MKKTEMKEKMLEFCKKLWNDAESLHPDFVLEAHSDYLIIDPSPFTSRIAIPVKITLEQTVAFYKEIYYYLNDKNINSLKEYLQLGEIPGFYKEIGALGKFCFLWFRYINSEGLQIESDKIKLPLSRIHLNSPKDQITLF